MTYPAVAGHDTIGELDLAVTGQTLGASYPLSPLIPFHAGQIEMIAGVVSMDGQSAVGRLARVVSRVTSLMPAAVGIGTAVETATGIANTAVECVEDLFGLPNAAIALGMHQLFAPHLGKSLTTGLYAIVNPRSADNTNERITERSCLKFDGEELKYYDASRARTELHDYDWLVLEIGGTTHRPYTSFPSVVEAFGKAVSDISVDPARAATELNAAITLVAMSTQVVRADRKSIFDELRHDFDQVASAAGVRFIPDSEAATNKCGALAGGEEDFTDFLLRPA
jgi:hypothetical protein